MAFKVLGARRMLLDFTGARDYYVGLFSDTNTELDGGGYNRVQLPSAGWTVAAASVSEGGENRLKAFNTAVRNYPTPTAQWGDPTIAKMMSAAQAGDVYADGNLSANVDAPAVGAVVRFNAQDFSLYIVTDD